MTNLSPDTEIHRHFPTSRYSHIAVTHIMHANSRITKYNSSNNTIIQGKAPQNALPKLLCWS